MFVEFTLDETEAKRVLINSDHVVDVIDFKSCCHMTMSMPPHLDVKEDFEETKKRLGLSITPRAGTLAI